MAWILPATHTSLARSVAVLAQGKMLSMLGLLLSVMVFQHMLDHVGAAGNAAKELQALNVPVLLVVAVLPCIAGAITGTAFGFVGTSFPIILPLIAASIVVYTGDIYAGLWYPIGIAAMSAIVSLLVLHETKDNDINS